MGTVILELQQKPQAYLQTAEAAEEVVGAASSGADAQNKAHDPAKIKQTTALIESEARRLKQKIVQMETALRNVPVSAAVLEGLARSGLPQVIFEELFHKARSGSTGTESVRV